MFTKTLLSSSSSSSNSKPSPPYGTAHTRRSGRTYHIVTHPVVKLKLEITPFQRDAMIAISPSELVKRFPAAAARALGHNDWI
jgi:hypothetical protein